MNKSFTSPVAYLGALGLVAVMIVSGAAYLGLFTTAESSASAAKANVHVVASRSSCREVLGSANIYVSLALRNSGGESGTIQPWVNFRYDDGGDSADAPADPVTVPPNTTIYTSFDHSYDATGHSLVECLVSDSGGSTSSTMRLRVPR